VGFLRRLFGGGSADPTAEAEPAPAPRQEELDDEERHYERDLARFEQERLDDIQQRQLRYADRAWTPPAQGGPERSDDADGEGGPETG
jgi:hypothetical protein